MEYIGGYDDYLRQRQLLNTQNKKESVKIKADKPSAPKRKLSYNEQRELEELPEKIALLEKQQQALQSQISDPNFYNQDKALVQKTFDELQILEQELQAAYQRWESLEA